MLAAAIAVTAAVPARTITLPDEAASGPPPLGAASSPPGNNTEGAIEIGSGMPSQAEHTSLSQPLPPTRNETIAAFAGRSPRYWGLQAPGVLSRLPRGASGIALTIDFCGGPGGNGFDQDLIAVLRARRIPATLFMNSRWINANAGAVRELAAEPLFELANHGTTHRPLSTTGNSAYGITGTKTIEEVYDEIMANDAQLTAVTGSRPRYFRSGTAYLDDVAADIVNSLGITPAGFSINADGGATFPPDTVTREAAKATPGDIIICHGNHPGRGTAQGLAVALDKLTATGKRFIRLP